MTPHWFRLSLDLDSTGNPIGISYEVRQSERIVAIHVLPVPDPFTTVEDELHVLVSDVEDRYGIQLPLL